MNAFAEKTIPARFSAAEEWSFKPMRIRTIKPEFWRSQDTAERDFFTRLLFIGLWNYVDDNGVGEADAHLIRSDLFPRDRDVAKLTKLIDGALTELSLSLQVIRYESEGRSYLFVTNWEEHQRINRPTKSKKPLPTSDDIAAAFARADSSLNPHGEVSEDSLPEQGNKGAREQGNKGTRELGIKGSRDPGAAPVGAAIARRVKTDENFQTWWEAYPRRAARGKAREAWDKAIDRGATTEALLAGAERYRDDPNRDDGFTKHPATWLNQECWHDDPLPSRSQSGSGELRGAQVAVEIAKQAAARQASGFSATLPDPHQLAAGF